MLGERTQPESVLDRSILDDLAALDAGLVADVVQSFLGDVPLRIEALHGHVATVDAHAVSRAAHALKGSALAVGATGLRDVCVALERAAQSGDTDGIRAHAADLAPAFAQVRTALEAWW